jgi:hypothetical protein
MFFFILFCRNGTFRTLPVLEIRQNSGDSVEFQDLVGFQFQLFLE